MAQRFQQETPPKKRNMPFVQRRGDGFTEFEAMGMVQLVRTRWREGWDVIAQLHNQQHPGHNRTGDSLKKKFSRLYRASVPQRGAKNHSVILLAHQVHREMIDGVTITPEEAAAEQEQQPEAYQTEERAASIATESEHSWVDVPDTAATEPAALAPPAVSSPATSASAAATAAKMAAPITVAPRSRFARRSEWQNQVTRINTEAAGAALPSTSASTEELLTSVLKVILQSQHQRDLDREEERVRREEEREQRKKEMDLWRQEMERRRAEDREERLEGRRRHEQLMQMMTMLAGKGSSAAHQDSE